MGKKILIVDDEHKLVELINEYLLVNGFETIMAYNGADGLRLHQIEAPDLIVLDLMLPDISGEEICRQIRKSSRVPIIILTAKASEDDRIEGLETGADDYIIKPFSPKELIARIKAVLRRVGTESEKPKILSFHQSDLVINLEGRAVYKAGAQVLLTPIEYKILAAMAKRPLKVFTRDELVSILFDDYAGYDRTIDSHIKNLRKKIETNHKNYQYIITVHGVGYKFGQEKG